MKPKINAKEFKGFVYRLDADGNGYISPEEFKKRFNESAIKLGVKLTNEQIQEAISRMDKDGDGLLSIKEVIEGMVSVGYLNKADGFGIFFTLTAIGGSVAFGSLGLFGLFGGT